MRVVLLLCHNPMTSPQRDLQGTNDGAVEPRIPLHPDAGDMTLAPPPRAIHHPDVVRHERHRFCA
jgi:hypothetical protein